MMEREKNREMDALEEEIQRMRIQGQEQRDQLKAQVQFLEGEIQRLKELAHQKNKDLESQINQFSLVKKNLEVQYYHYIRLGGCSYY
jgi:predicted  nucleic acid-binding Zn-ribbon protein